MRKIGLLLLSLLLGALCYSQSATHETADYTKARIRIIREEAFQKMRQGTLYYASEATDPVNSLTRNPLNFKWGETVYLLIDNFPYRAAETTHPPIVSVEFTIGGKTVRTFYTEARRYMAPTPTEPAFQGPEATSGFALMHITLQNAADKKPPKQDGEVAVRIIATEASGKPVTHAVSQKLKIPFKRPR